MENKASMIEKKLQDDELEYVVGGSGSSEKNKLYEVGERVWYYPNGKANFMRHSAEVVDVYYDDYSNQWVYVITSAGYRKGLSCNEKYLAKAYS